MTMSMNYKKTLNGIALVAFLAVAPMAAHADQLIEGCHPTVKMQEMLKAQDQKPLIIADDFTASTEAKKIAVAAYITSNADGNLGYFLTSDQPLSGQSTKLCVNGAFTDIKMYSTSLNEPPSSAYIGGGFGNDLKLGYARGERLLVQATPVVEKDGKVEAKAAVVNFIANPQTKIGGQILVDRSSGASGVLTNFENLQITPYGDALLGKQNPPVQMVTAIDATMAATPELPNP